MFRIQLPVLPALLNLKLLTSTNPWASFSAFFLKSPFPEHMFFAYFFPILYSLFD